MTSQIDKTPNSLWRERDVQTRNANPVKSIKRLKSPKKSQECKKSTNDMKIEDVFLNSEYFKYHSGNISSLSFCSGDNGEHHWKVDTKFEIPLHKASQSKNGVAFEETLPKEKRDIKKSEFGDTTKSDTAVLNKEKVSRQWQQKLKKISESPRDNTNQFLEGILSGKSRLDRDLITLITEQMFLAERELEITRTHLMETISKLNERDIEILHLHEKIHNLQKNNKTGTRKGKADGEGKEGGEDMTKTTEDYQRLIKASEKLKKQVKDMEEFLNDYGLVWVGDKEANQKPDFDKILKSFQRLNAVANEPKIIQTVVGAKFELPREIPVVLYSNGLLLRNSDFRAYSKMSTSMFLQDVEDGYFPSELQTEFPEGVPFEVVDKRNEVYKPNDRAPAFQGHGNRLGSTFEGKPSSLVYLEPLKKARNHDSQPSPNQESPLRRIHKKRSRNAMTQEDRGTSKPHGCIPAPDLCHSPIGELSETETGKGERLNVKVRYGKEKTESFFLQVHENERMNAFQRELRKKLCEIYHEDCLVSEEFNNRNIEFEVHVYGKNPFRLSEKLNLQPSQLGIINNCVVNVTEL